MKGDKKQTTIGNLKSLWEEGELCPGNLFFFVLLHSSNIVTKECGRERYQQVAKTEVWR